MSFGVKKEKIDIVDIIGLFVFVIIIIIGPEILEDLLNADLGYLDNLLFYALGTFVLWLLFRRSKKQPDKKRGAS